jgi:hypothetical protein
VRPRLNPRQRELVAINLVGGLAVLGSYVAGAAMHPESTRLLWGGVPAALKPFYTISMLTAAAGYFPFTYLLVFRTDPENSRIAGRLSYGCFHFLYLLILLPSALWMPLTFQLVDRWSAALWAVIRIVLALVGIGSLGLLAALATLAPVTSRRLYAFAIAGVVAFCVQTALLDATVWPAYFPTPGPEGPAS